MATKFVPNSTLRFQMVLYLETTRQSEGDNITIDFEVPSIVAAAERVCSVARALDKCPWIQNWRIQAVMQVKAVDCIHETTGTCYHADLN